MAEQIALDDSRLRQRVARGVMRTFGVANGATLVAVCLLVLLDEFNILHQLISPDNRIITNQVIMALLGATTVQVGTTAVIIARYLFPGRPRDTL